MLVNFWSTWEGLISLTYCSISMFGAHEMLNEEGRYFPYFSGENTKAWTL